MCIKDRVYVAPCTVHVLSGNYYTIEPETSQITNLSKAAENVSDTITTFLGWDSTSHGVDSMTVYIVHDTEIVFKTKTEYKTTIAYSLNDLPEFSSSQQAWYPQDTTITVKAPSIPGYTFVKWIINNAKTDTDTVLTIKVNASLVILGKYKRLFHVSISTNADSSLEMIINGTIKSAPFWLDVGDSSIVTLLPKTPELFEISNFVAGNDTRYDFAYWENDGQLSPERSDIIRSDTAFKAIYKKSFLVAVHGYSTDSTITDINKWFPKDTIIQLSPPMLTNMAFSNWVINGDVVQNNSLLVLKVNEPKSITALYGRLAQLIVLTEPPVPQIIITIGDSASASICSRVFTKGTKAKFGVAPIQEFRSGDLVDGTDVRYEFVKWYNEADTSNPLSRQIDSPVVYKAVIRTKYKIEIVAKTAQINTISYFLPKDTTVVLTPNTYSGYKFSHWNINKDSIWANSRLTMKMNGPKYLEAVYLKTNSISITSLPDDSMIISVQGKPQFTPYSFQLATGDSAIVSVNSPIYLSNDSLFSGPGVRYTFIKWFNTANTSNTITIKSTNTAITQFLMQKSYVAQITTVPLQIGKSQQNLWVVADSVTLLTAASCPGYFFDHWEIQNTDTVFNSQISLTITKPMHIKAVYDPNFTIHDMDSLFTGWQPILGTDGPQTLDKLVAYYTPDCKQFSSASDIQSFADKFRQSMISSMKLDLNKQVLSDQLQQTITDSAYSIEVHRLEVFNGRYLSVNVYLPRGKNYQECPLVVMAPGCGSDLSTEYMQYLAGNLATQGMVVVSADGYCSNGRRQYIDITSNSPIAYARELIGLPCPVSAFIQELISTTSWAINKYFIVNPQKIGCTGYSHGGCMSLLLSQIDKRISCVSIPATGVGSTCGNNLITSDIWIASDPEYGPDFMWSVPNEVPLRPLNSEFTLLFPSYVHSTCGDNDWGASSANEQPVYDYATQIYATASFQDRILFNTDPETHNYDVGRRQDTYAWFNHVFTGSIIQTTNEIHINLHSDDTLEPDISGSATLNTEFQSVIQSMKNTRFNGSTPNSDVSSRVNVEMDQLFGDFKQDIFSNTMKISKTWNDLKVSSYRLDGLYYSLPITIFQNLKIKNGSQAFYLPKAGTVLEKDTITSLLNRYGTVISIDYFGIGELMSDRVMLITYADYFMNNNPSLPKMIANSLRSYIKTTTGKFDIIGNGWASSFFASCLQYLEPTLISKSILYGVPSDELGSIASNAMNPPYLLLGNGLFSKITVAEIDAVNKLNQ